MIYNYFLNIRFCHSSEYNRDLPGISYFLSPYWRGSPSWREAGFGAQGGDGGVVSFGTGAGAAGGVVDNAGGIFPVHGVNVVGVFLLEVQKGRKCSDTSCPFAFIYYNFIL